MKLRRAARIAAGVACLGAAFMIFAPHATSYISRSAVVNAPIISIKSPFDGALMSDALTPATPVLPATAIVELQASRSSRTELARLEARIGILAREEVSISTEIAALTQLDQQLLVRMEQVQTLARQVLQTQLSGLRGSWRQRANTKTGGREMLKGLSGFTLAGRCRRQRLRQRRRWRSRRTVR